MVTVMKNAKALLLAAMLLLGMSAASAASGHRKLAFLPHKSGGGVLHHLAQAAAIGGAAVDAAGLATGAYGLATGDKNAQHIGAAELGVGTAGGLAGAGASVASRCKWAVGTQITDWGCHRG